MDKEKERIKLKQTNEKRILPILKYELNEFFNTTNEQIIRITSNKILNSNLNNSQLEKSPKTTNENLTLENIYSLASHVADNMSQNEQKIDLESIRDFHLSSAAYQYHSNKPSTIRRTPIRLIDILPKDDMIYDRQLSTVLSEQRPCTPVSNVSKPNINFIKQRQNTNFILNFNKPKKIFNIQNNNNINNLEKTIRDTLLVNSIPLRMSSFKNLNKKKCIITD